MKRTELPETSFREDIASLRGVAILGVVLFHAKILWAKGGFLGVDLFYVISGYLITGLLLKEFKQKRSIKLSEFYARRFRRLFPAALVVLIATAIAFYFLAPITARRELSFDLLSALLFLSNYNFAHHATDYFASQTPSPVLHFWSLSLEEQFYFLWPLSFLLLTRKYFRYKIKLQFALLVTTSAAIYFAIYLSHHSQPWSFFSLPSRAWEISAGALLATLPQITQKLSKILKNFLFAISISYILFLLFNPSAITIFPSWQSYSMVGVVILVLDLGRGQDKLLVAKVFGNPLLNFLGNISYSLYLWHWPVYVLFGYYLAQPLNNLEAALCVLAAILLAIFSTYLIENPIRIGWLSRKKASISLTLATILLITSSAGVFAYNIDLNIKAKQNLAKQKLVLAQLANSLLASPNIANELDSNRKVIIKNNNLINPKKSTKDTNTASTNTASTKPTAPIRKVPQTPAVLPQLPDDFFDIVKQDLSIPQLANNIPDISQLPASQGGGALPKITFPQLDSVDLDRAQPYNDRCHTQENLPPTTVPCLYGDTSTSKTVVLFGDSHALSWFPTINAVAKINHWKLLSLTMSACSPANLPQWEPSIDARSTNCDLWRSNSIARILAAKPFAILIASTRGFQAVKSDNQLYIGEERINIFEQGMNQTISALQPTGAKIIYLHDTPADNNDPIICLSTHVNNYSDCAFSLDKGFDANWFQIENNIITSNNIASIDPTFWVCPENPCSLVQGNFLVFLDGGHLTSSYATSLAPLMNRALRRIVGK